MKKLTPLILFVIACIACATLIKTIRRDALVTANKTKQSEKSPVSPPDPQKFKPFTVVCSSNGKFSPVFSGGNAYDFSAYSTYEEAARVAKGLREMAESESRDQAPLTRTNIWKECK